MSDQPGPNQESAHAVGVEATEFAHQVYLGDELVGEEIHHVVGPHESRIDQSTHLRQVGGEEEIGEDYDTSRRDAEREEFREDERGKYCGPQRLRMHVGVEPGHEHLAFRYYFEQFGDVKLPAD